MQILEKLIKNYIEFISDLMKELSGNIFNKAYEHMFSFQFMQQNIGQSIISLMITE